MKRTVIAGIGSPHGDDRAGWIVIEALDAELGAPERAAAPVTTIALDRPGLVLLEHLRDAERAVLVDALHHGDAPGTLTVLEADDLQRDASCTSTHGVGVAEALALGAALKRLPAELILIGITIGAHTPDAGISASVRIASDLLARHLASWLRAGGDTWPPLLSAAEPPLRD